MISLDIPVSSPSVSLLYKLESDEVASSFYNIYCTKCFSFFLISCIWVSLPCQNCPMYKSDDVVPSFFHSTTTTVPNASILLYTGALLSAVCGKVISCIHCPICQKFHIYINYKVIKNQLQQSAIIYNQLQSFNSRFTIVLHNYLQPLSNHRPLFTTNYNHLIVDGQ